jgi:hypothetical protein
MKNFIVLLSMAISLLFLPTGCKDKYKNTGSQKKVTIEQINQAFKKQNIHKFGAPEPPRYYKPYLDITFQPVVAGPPYYPDTVLDTLHVSILIPKNYKLNLPSTEIPVPQIYYSSYREIYYETVQSDSTGDRLKDSVYSFYIYIPRNHIQYGTPYIEVNIIDVTPGTRPEQTNKGKTVVHHGTINNPILEFEDENIERKNK